MRRQFLVIGHRHFFFLHLELANLTLLGLNLLHEFMVLFLHGCVAFEAFFKTDSFLFQEPDFIIFSLLELQNIFQILCLLVQLASKFVYLVLVNFRHDLGLVKHSLLEHIS